MSAQQRTQQSAYLNCEKLHGDMPGMWINQEGVFAGVA